MNDPIKVRVVGFSKRAFYMLQWRDPTTGRKKSKSSKVPFTDLKKDRTQAERVAAQLEADLNAGRVKGPATMTWERFRERYEAEVYPGLAEGTCEKIDTTFGHVEAILRPRRLAELTTEAISRWTAGLRGDARTDATVASYCRHLRAALNWAHDMGFLPVPPRVREPRAGRGARLMKGRPLVLEHYRGRLCGYAARLPSRLPVSSRGSEGPTW